MACNDCPDLEPNPNSGCLQPTVTSCITYNGEDKACADISAGQTLNQVIEQLADNDCTLQEQIDDIKDDIDELSGSVNDLQDQIDEINNSITTFSCEDLSSCSIDNLSDVDVTPVSGDILKFNGTNWVNYTPEEIPAYQFTCEELSGCTLDELSGVTLTDPVSGQVLFFNGTQWINTTFDTLIQNVLDQIQINYDLLTTQIDMINSRLDVCCTTEAGLDVEFSGTVWEVTAQMSSASPKLLHDLSFISGGADMGVVDGIMQVSFYVEDSTGLQTRTFIYITPQSINTQFDHQLYPEMKAAIASSSNPKTITYLVRFKDTSANTHFVAITGNIPNLPTTGSSATNLPTTYVVDEF